MDNKNFDIIEWVSKYLTHDLTDAEKERLMNWVEFSDENKSWFYMMIDFKFVKNKRKEWKSIDVTGGWDALIYKRNRRKRHRLGVNLLKYASVLLLLGVVTICIMQEEKRNIPVLKQEILPGTHKAILLMTDGMSVELGIRQNKMLREQDGTTINVKDEAITYISNDTLIIQEQLYHTLVVPRGGEFILTLSDGTVVQLNAESRLTYPVKFTGDTRCVRLEGEGFFRVMHDDRKSFIVETSGVEITVLGTEFNVSNYVESEEILTTLVKGKVRISSSRNSLSHVLRAGEQAVYDKQDGHINVNVVDVSYATAWKDGCFRFRDRPLEEIMRFISRWYDVEVIYKEEEIKKCLFGCNFDRHATIGPLLELFENTGTIHFEIENKKIIVSK